jgi:hypothetical protein
MGRMVRDPKPVSNQDRHSRLGPHIALETQDLGSLGQELQELVPLGPGQPGRCPWGWLVAQTFDPSISAPFQPLANGPLGYAQSLSDVPLLPTFLVEFPGPQAATFPPIGSLV